MDTSEYNPNNTYKDSEDLKSIISEVKRCFGKISVADYDEEDNLNKIIDNGMILLEHLDKSISQIECKNTEIQIQNISNTAEWHLISDGVLPDNMKSVLFATKSGQVFDGYLTETDYASPKLTSDKKLTFSKYNDGGKWFRYRFRDLLDMRSVIAWSYLPSFNKKKG